MTYVHTYSQQQQECSLRGKGASGQSGLRNKTAVCRTRVFKRLNQTRWREEDGLRPIRSVYVAFLNARYSGQQAKKRGWGKIQKNIFPYYTVQTVKNDIVFDNNPVFSTVSPLQ